jgi:hypothetical protein
MTELTKKFVRKQAEPYFQRIVDRSMERENYPTGEKLGVELENLRNTQKPTHAITWIKKMRAVGPKVGWLTDNFFTFAFKQFKKPTSKHFLINGVILWCLGEYFTYTPGPRENFATSVNYYPHGLGPEYKNIKGTGVEHAVHTDLGKPSKFRM